MSSSRTKLVSSRLTDAEYEAVERAAGAATISAWARETLLRAATQSLPALVSPLRRVNGEADVHIVSPPADRTAASAQDQPADQRPRVLPRSRVSTLRDRHPAQRSTEMVTTSDAWLPTTLIGAAVGAIGIAVSRYAHAEADAPWLEVIGPAAWGALAVILAGVLPMLADALALRLANHAAPTANPGARDGQAPVPERDADPRRSRDHEVMTC